MGAHVTAPHEATYRAARYATQPQIDLLTRILAENELYTGHYDRLWKMLEVHEVDVRTPGDGTRMTFQTASDAIDWVKAQVARLRAERPAPAASQPSTTPHQFVTMGLFEKDGTVYLVQPNKAGTRVYAKRLVESPPRYTAAGEVVDFDYEFDPGAIYKLTEADRMTVERAMYYAVRYGKCMKCKKVLKAAKTVQTVAETGLMLGPVCRKYLVA
jgi:hypothetical protein